MAAAVESDAANDQLDIFISYTRPDVAWARWLAWFLESAGYTTRYQYRDFRVGENFVAQINAALGEAQAVLLVLSEDYNLSKFTEDEWTSAYYAPLLKIPVKIDDADPPPYLQSLTWIELGDCDEKEAGVALNAALSDLQPDLEPSNYDPDRFAQAARHGAWFPGVRHPIPLGATSMLDRAGALETVAEAMAGQRGPVVIVPSPLDARRGSTALAASYVQSFATSYDTVQWIAGSPPQLLPLEFRRIGRSLDLPSHACDAAGVYEALATRYDHRALVVIDDVPKLGALHPWLPEDGVRVLLTASDDTYGGMSVVPLEALEGETVRDHLAAAARCAPADVEQVNELLEGDPVAVTLAAHWLRAVEGATPEAYVAALEQAGGGDAGERAAQASVLALREACPEAHVMLLVLGQAARRPFPLAAFRRAGGSAATAVDEVILDREARYSALRALVIFGIAVEAEGMIAVSGPPARAAARLADADLVAAAAAGMARTITRSLRAARIEGDPDLADALVSHAYAVLHPANGVAAPPEYRVELGLELAETFIAADADELARAGLDQIGGRDGVAPDHLADLARLAALLDERAGGTAQAIHTLHEAAELEGVTIERRARLLGKLGQLRSAAGDPGAAAEDFRVAEQLLKDSRQPHAALEVLGMRSEAERRAGDLQAALATAENRLQVAADDIGPGQAVAEAHGDRGLAHLALEDPDAATGDLVAALSMLDAGDPGRIAELSSALAEAHLQRDEPGRARAMLGRAAVEIARQHGRRTAQLAPILERIADTYDGGRDPLDAVRAAELRNRAAALRGEDVTPLEGFGPLDEHLRKVIAGRCIPIVGPGFTDRVFMPRRRIARSLADREDYRYPMAEFHKEDLPHVAQYLSIRMGTRSFRKELEEYFLDRLREAYHEALSAKARSLESTVRGATYRVIAEAGAVARWVDPFEYHAVLARLDCEVYVSTGPAGLLSAALVEAGKRPTIVSCNWLDEERPGAPEDLLRETGTTARPLVLHLFGDFRDPNSVLLTERDYVNFVIRYATKKDRVPPDVNKALVDSSLLFLGFDLDEWDFTVLLEAFVDQPGRTYSAGMPHAAVQIDSKATWEDAKAARKYLAELMDTRKVKVIFKDLGTLMTELAVGT